MKYIIGLFLIAVFVGIALLTFDSSKIEYSDFASATSTKVVQISGAWEKDNYTEYDSKKNTFTFYMKDDKNKTTKVIFTGSKPNNFDIAPRIVIKGKFQGDTFYASEILTKCPSKYQGNGNQTI
jgi:cytochrome c-type biogenesis protein CcmE